MKFQASGRNVAGPRECWVESGAHELGISSSPATREPARALRWPYAVLYQAWQPSDRPEFHGHHLLPTHVKPVLLILILPFFFLWTQDLAMLPRLGSSEPPASASQLAETKTAHHSAELVLVILII